jgi:hypothetical protein
LLLLKIKNVFAKAIWVDQNNFLETIDIPDIDETEKNKDAHEDTHSMLPKC